MQTTTKAPWLAQYKYDLKAVEVEKVQEIPCPVFPCTRHFNSRKHLTEHLELSHQRSVAKNVIEALVLEALELSK